VTHVPSSVTDTFEGTALVTLADATIRTGGGATPPTIDVSLPTGSRLIVSAQDGAGPELAILEVESLAITGTLRVRGERPLVIIARSTIVANVIDASAEEETPGGGGRGPRLGPGAGGDGGLAGSADSGGGGGGFGTPGATGQKSGASAAGLAGPAYGTPELATLEGGSGGGRFAPLCAGESAGAGGGAIQLYAGDSIQIDGAVHANGGGGAGGVDCINTGTSGAGGGSGGAIYLETLAVLGAGSLLAQGGGGGGATDVSQQTVGGDGDDGPATIAPASGGSATGTGVSGEDNRGGAGGFRDAGPPALANISGTMSGNGGGGGGAVGRIVIRAPAPGNLGTSPMAVVEP
jgi:hypothetical protein